MSNSIDFETFIGKHDRRGVAGHEPDGQITQEDAETPGSQLGEVFDDIDAIPYPADRLRALDAVGADVAAARLQSRYGSSMATLQEALKPLTRDGVMPFLDVGHAQPTARWQRARRSALEIVKREYARMQPNDQYLFRKYYLVGKAPSALRAIDDGGQRVFYGTEEFKPVMLFKDALVFDGTLPPPRVRADTRIRMYKVPAPSGNTAMSAEDLAAGRIPITYFPEARRGEDNFAMIDMATGELTPFPADDAVRLGASDFLGFETVAGVKFAISNGNYGENAARLLAFGGDGETVLDFEWDIGRGEMPNDITGRRLPNGDIQLFISDTAPAYLKVLGLELVNAQSALIEMRLREQPDGTLKVVQEPTYHLKGHASVENGDDSIYAEPTTVAKNWLGGKGWGGIDGIDVYGDHVYFRTMQGDLYRVPADDPEGERVEWVASLPPMDGFQIDDDGNLIFGNVQSRSIDMFNVDTGRFMRVMHHPSLFQWIDEVQVVRGEDGKRYAAVTVSFIDQLLKEPPFFDGALRREDIDKNVDKYFVYLIDIEDAYRAMEKAE